MATPSTTSTIERNTQHRYEVTHTDFPLHCPMDGMRQWNSHPRVHLPIENTGQAKCPYCGADYVLVDQPSAHPSPSAILVVGPAWVGDMTMAQTLFRLLKLRYPNAAIDVMAPAWSKALLSRMPEVRDALTMPFGHGEFKPFKRLQIGRELRVKRYDWAIVMPITWKSALVPFGANIPRRTGFTGEMRFGLLNDCRKLNKSRLPRMIDRYMALGLGPDEALPASPLLPRLESTSRAQQKALKELGLSLGERAVLAICPGAEYGPAKRWPTKYFADIARWHVARGGQVWLFGSEKDTGLGDAIASDTGQHCVNLCGKTTLQQAIDLLALSTSVLTNDSGLMHVAAALNKPIYAIYGSSTPDYTPPLSESAHIISLRLACSPCFARECKYGHTKCLNLLTPDRVKEAMSSTACAR